MASFMVVEMSLAMIRQAGKFGAAPCRNRRHLQRASAHQFFEGDKGR
jgi:hypothetical protein